MTQKPCEVFAIEESYDKSVEKLSVTERYYTPLYRLGEASADDFCILFHSNRICVITLAPSHTILTQNKTVESIDCQVSSNVNRLDNTVSGKGKRGAQVLTPSSVIFFIVCSDGSRHPVYSCVPGKLVEINDRLMESPNLIVEKSSDQGYLAIVLPPMSASARYKEQLLSLDSYRLELAKRSGTCS